MKRIAVALLLVATGLLVAVPAEGDDAARRGSQQRALQLSVDGVNWSPRLREPLFGFDQMLVPGREETGRFLARHHGDGKARLMLRVRLDRPGSWFRKELVQLRVKLGHRSWRRVWTAGEVARVVLPEGATVPVLIEVRLVRRAGKQTMGKSLRFECQLRLTGVQRGNDRPT